MVGSTEWAEENRDWIRENAVAYLNVDIGVRGHSIKFKATPNLSTLIYDITKRVQSPYTNRSVYDVWKEREPPRTGVVGLANGKKGKRRSPYIGPLGPGSDHAAFLHHLGVSALDMRFDGSPGLYHSNYDSFNWITTQVDPDFLYHRAITQILGAAAIRLADDPILPLDAQAYAREIGGYVSDLDSKVAQASSASGHKAVSQRVLRHMADAANELEISARRIEKEKHRLRKKYGEECSMDGRYRYSMCSGLRSSINSRLYKLERDFIDPVGIHGREWYKHVLVGPGRWRCCGAQTLPALTEAVEDGNWTLFKRLEKSTADILQRAAWSLRER
ncbi:Zn-dependent exopeptidase [Martensiomyces pterosporus]|nr:Zn-dependent exopeptidase [Martensiomyces pterosporus]